MPAELPAETVAAAIAAYSSGEEIPAIKARFGISHSSLYRMLYARKIQLRRSDPDASKRHKANPEIAARNAAICADYANGVPIAEIKINYNLNGQTIYNALHAGGIALRKAVPKEKRVKVVPVLGRCAVCGQTIRVGDSHQSDAFGLRHMRDCRKWPTAEAGRRYGTDTEFSNRHVRMAA